MLNATVDCRESQLNDLPRAVDDTYANLYKCQAACDEERHVDRIRGDSGVWSDSGEEFVKRKSFVTGESEDLAGRCGDLVNGAEKVHNDHYEDQDYSRGSRSRYSAYDGHVWLATRVVQV